MRHWGAHGRNRTDDLILTNDPRPVHTRLWLSNSWLVEPTISLWRLRQSIVIYGHCCTKCCTANRPLVSESRGRATVHRESTPDEQDDNAGPIISTRPPSRGLTRCQFKSPRRESFRGTSLHSCQDRSFSQSASAHDSSSGHWSLSLQDASRHQRSNVFLVVCAAHATLN